MNLLVPLPCKTPGNELTGAGKERRKDRNSNTAKLGLCGPGSPVEEP